MALRRGDHSVYLVNEVYLVSLVYGPNRPDRQNGQMDRKDIFIDRFIDLNYIWEDSSRRDNLKEMSERRS